MQIKMLKESPQHIDTIIDWLNNEFGNDNSRNFYMEIIQHSLKENELPITFVALENGVLLATVGIWRADLLSRQELFPWLSALIVNPSYREKGIGQKLQEHVSDYCKLRGYKEIFLYTDLVGYYEKSGWKAFDKGYEYSGSEVCIYKQILRDANIK